MEIEVRPVVAVAILFLVVGLLVGGSTVTGLLIDTPEDEPRATPEVDTVELADGSQLWPYTSRSERFGDRTLALNILVYGNDSLTKHIMESEGLTRGDWEDVQPEEYDVTATAGLLNATGANLRDADGAVRYTYVQTPDGENMWLDESYQLKEGDYLGVRDHLRAYQDPAGDNWTVFQAHTEHWDWFQVRHNVHTIQETQNTVELEFVDHPLVEELVRDRWGNDRSSDSDGWATTIWLDDDAAPFILGALLLLSVQTWRVREVVFHEDFQQVLRLLGAAASIIGLYLFVRFGALQAEAMFPDVHIHVLAAMFYPLLFVGIPVVTYLTTRQLSRTLAFIAGTGGFFIALLMDYTYLGVTTLPLDTLVQHVALAIALGFIAAGASRTARRPERQRGYVRTGILLWVVAMTVPLLVHIPHL